MSIILRWSYHLIHIFIKMFGLMCAQAYKQKRKCVHKDENILSSLKKNVCWPFRHDRKQFLKTLMGFEPLPIISLSFYVKTYKRQRWAFKRFFLKLWTFWTLCAFLLAYEKSNFKSLIFFLKFFLFLYSTKEEWSSCVSRNQQRKGCEERAAKRFLHPWTMGELPKFRKRGLSCQRYLWSR